MFCLWNVWLNSTSYFWFEKETVFLRLCALKVRIETSHSDHRNVSCFFRTINSFFIWGRFRIHFRLKGHYISLVRKANTHYAFKPNNRAWLQCRRTALNAGSFILLTTRDFKPSVVSYCIVSIGVRRTLYPFFFYNEPRCSQMKSRQRNQLLLSVKNTIDIGQFDIKNKFWQRV